MRALAPRSPRRSTDTGWDGWLAGCSEAGAATSAGCATRGRGIDRCGWN
uniref:Uncharacterized protein n=1 Tax=Arundo donax TaxID=35708 RepID=A0A0A8YDR4_ARUDO